MAEYVNVKETGLTLVLGGSNASVSMLSMTRINEQDSFLSDADATGLSYD